MTTPWIRRLAMLATVAGVLAGTSACSGTTADAASISPASVAPEFTATASVIDRADTGPLLCLGGERQSRPPQCIGGVAIVGWDWEDVVGEATESQITWGGDYAVQGTWDGSTFTMTRAAEPAADTAVQIQIPSATDSPAQTTVPRTAEQLDAIRVAVSAGHPSVVMTGIETTANRVLLTVAYDDGALQAALDAQYGIGTVLVSSVLAPA